MSVTTPTGGAFDHEKLIVFRRGAHVVVYRTLDELIEMLRMTHDNISYGAEKIEVEFIYTAVEQARGATS
jgi:hypothetical protein